MTETIGRESWTEMAETFWKMRPETLQNMAGALLLERRDALWPRLLAPLCSMVRDGEAVGPLEQAWIARWLDSMCLYDVEVGEVQVVQLSRAQVAAMLDGRDASAERAIRGLQEVGVLELVHRGVKGHSSLYCVLPVPGRPHAPAPWAGAGETGPPGPSYDPTVT